MCHDSSFYWSFLKLLVYTVYLGTGAASFKPLKGKKLSSYCGDIVNEATRSSSPSIKNIFVDISKLIISWMIVYSFISDLMSM